MIVIESSTGMVLAAKSFMVYLKRLDLEIFHSLDTIFVNCFKMESPSIASVKLYCFLQWASAG